MVTAAEGIEHVAAFAIPRGHGQARGARRNHAPRSEWRIIEEALVGIDLHIGGVIDRNQPQLVDVVHLFHRLDEAQAELAIHQAQ